jgi:hypothetical protein
MADRDDPKDHLVNGEGPEPRRIIPAVLFTVAILVVVFIVFAVIQWARYHD